MRTTHRAQIAQALEIALSDLVPLLGTEDWELDNRKDLFAAYGDAAMLLSNLESAVGQLLEILTDPQAFIGSLLVDRLSFAQRIDYTRKLAKLRFGPQSRHV